MPSNEVHAVLGTQRHPLRRNSFINVPEMDKIHHFRSSGRRFLSFSASVDTKRV